MVAFAVGALAVVAVARPSFAETKVTMEKVHLCCKSCVTGAEKAVKSVNGATAACDQKAGTISITAPDEATAQKAVDALVDAGYYGKTTGATLKADNASTTVVKTAEVTGFHNCCPKCSTAINDTLKKAGAKGEVAKKETKVTVTGDIDPSKLTAAFEDAGLHAKVEGK
jgi:hypothetical protein